MKKCLALMLAMLMLALPVFSVAEAPAAEEPAAEKLELNTANVLSSLENKTFAGKYVAEGQRTVANVSFQLGDGGLPGIPDELKSAITELLNALKIQSASQMTTEQAQESVRILLNGEEVLFGSAAIGENGIYLACSFLGDKVIQITSEQISKAAVEQLQTLKEKAEQNRESIMIGTLRTLSAKLGLEATVAEILSGITVQEVGDVQPADALFKVKTVTTLPLTKEALTGVTTELAELIWSLPEVQQAVNSASSGNEPMTKEQLTEALNAIPGQLAEDTELRIYTDETGKMVQAGVDLVLVREDGSLIPVSYTELSETKDDGLEVTSAFTMIQDEMISHSDFAMVLKKEDKKGSLNAALTVTVSDGEQKVVPVQGPFTLDWTDEETVRNARMDVRSEILGSPDPLVYLMAMDYSDKDLGDHAELNAVLTMGTEKEGTLLTVTVDGKTEPAEDYIIKEDTVRIAELDKEGLQAFGKEVGDNIEPVVRNLLTKLPESVQQLIAPILDGTEQTQPSGE